MRLVSVGSGEQSGDYKSHVVLFERGSMTTKKLLSYGGVLEKVDGRDAAIESGARRACREALREMAYFSTLDPRSFDTEDQSALVAEVVEKVKQCA
jgi:hypothetical protein